MSTLPSGSPPPLPYQSYTASQQDLDHLRVLSICWYVWAALAAIPAAIFLIYIVIGLILAVVGAAGGRDAAPAAFFGGFMVCFGVLMVALLATLAFFNFRCGANLKNRRGINLCYVMAVIACLHIPFGLILGIFTFVVLSRPTVKASFH